MKIGIYDPYLDDLGGGEKYMMTIAQCLAKEHRVDIFWDNKEDIARLAERFSLDFSEITMVRNIFSTQISTLQRLLATKKYDVIITLSDGSIPLVASKKLFIHIQQPLDHLQNVSFFDKMKVSRVTQFFCNSFYTKSFLEKKFSIHPIVIYPPVEISTKNVKKENIILHVGRFRSVNGADYKKQSVMIQAFQEMIDKGLKNWKFVIATSVNEKDMTTFQQMKKTASSYPIEFFVNLPNKKLWDLYNKAKMYWHASGYGEDLDQHPELAEHFGISTVEAMAAGAVPVVINAGGQKEIVTDHENGMVWNTLLELEKKTLLVGHDAKLWKKLSDNAKVSARKYGKKRFCEEIHSVIKK